MKLGTDFFLFLFVTVFLALGVVCFMNKFALKVMTLCYLMVFTLFGAPLSLGLPFIPHVVASPDFASFPSIDFKDFSDFFLENFGAMISLSTVITLLLSMTNNTELASLHFKQAEKGGSTTWMNCLFGSCN